MAIAAYRQAIEIKPTLGEAWWSLANLKTVQLRRRRHRGDEGGARARRTSSDDDRFHLDFALGKAMHDARRRGRGLRTLCAGNALRPEHHPYDVGEITKMVDRMHRSLHRRGVRRAGRRVRGAPIRSSSSACRAPDRPWSSRSCRRTARSKARRSFRTFRRWRAAAAALSARRARADRRSERRELGEEYLKRASVQRRTDRPFFIDKLPNNWLFVPFIQLILPNAKIIDARRHPLGCCFSNFRQHFARGQDFTYDLDRSRPLLCRLCAADGACRLRSCPGGSTA